MLELRPNCEYCDVDLPPDSPDARICSYECTFCAVCVEAVLRNVCPNCGGGFEPRPIRPAISHRPGVGLSHQPASIDRVHLSRDRHEIRRFTESLEAVPPALR